MPYPTTSDIAKLYTALSLSTGSANLSGPLLAAIEWWEKETGYRPFIGTVQTRTFDPPGAGGSYLASLRGGGRVLRFDNGLLISNPTVVSQSGTLVAGTDYWLRPNNALNASRPFEWMEFFAPVWGAPQSISITGTWGRALDLEADGFDAVVKKAAEFAAPEIMSMVTSGAVEQRAGEDIQNFGVSPLASELLIWRRAAQEVASSYKRVVNWL